MSEYAVMPLSDWQQILDTVRYGTEDSALLRSNEVAGEINDMILEADAVLDGSLEYYQNSRLTSVRQYGFACLTSLKSVVLPNVTTIGGFSFRDCSALERADFSSLSRICTFAFSRCGALTALVIRTNALCVLDATQAFGNTPIATGEGYVYVPAALVDEYKQADFWSTFADSIRAIEDYPEITGG